MNTALIRSWINRNNPKGREKLAATTEISISVIDKILNKGHRPNLDTARRIARAMGLTLDELSTPSSEDRPPAA